MIVRTGRRIPGVAPLGGVHAPISIVRMAVGDAYGAKEWREGEGDDEVAFRTERIERRICRAVAEFAFRQAERTGAKVFGGPKYTVSPTYEGMLKEEMDAAAERHPEVPYEPQLIDATFALLLSSAGDPLVIPALNRDGDILSDLVLPLFGSIAGSESLLVAFEDDFEPAAIMAEAAHGTAPSLQGKNVANPMAMILAGAALLSHGGEEMQRAGRAIREACLEAVAQGHRTADLGGHLGTSEFTDDVIARVRAKLEVWAQPVARELRDAACQVSQPSAQASTKSSAATGSNCAPASASTSASACSCVSERRYGRGEIIASNASAIARSLASTGMRRPLSPRGIAAAVPALVVEEDVRKRVVEAAQRQDEPRAVGRMPADLGQLVVRERARPCPAPAARTLTLPTSWSGAAQRRDRDPLAVPAELERDRLGERRDAGAVADGSGRALRARGRSRRACPGRIPRPLPNSYSRFSSHFLPTCVIRKNTSAASGDHGGRVDPVTLDRVGGRVARRSTRRARPAWPSRFRRLRSRRGTSATACRRCRPPTRRCSGER